MKEWIGSKEFLKKYSTAEIVVTVKLEEETEELYQKLSATLNDAYNQQSKGNQTEALQMFKIGYQMILDQINRGIALAFHNAEKCRNEVNTWMALKYLKKYDEWMQITTMMLLSKFRIEMEMRQTIIFEFMGAYDYLKKEAKMDILKRLEMDTEVETQHLLDNLVPKSTLQVEAKYVESNQKSTKPVESNQNAPEQAQIIQEVEKHE